MQKIMGVARKTWSHFMHDSFRRSSTLLIIAQLVNAGSAFLFWIICARLFDTHTVGLATAFISFGALVGTFTTLGLPTTVIRFLPRSEHKSQLFGAAFTLVLAASFVTSAIAYWIIQWVAPDLTFVQSSGVLVALLAALIVSNALAPLLDNVFMAFKKSEYILFKYTVTGLLRVGLPFAVTAMAIKGIVSVYTVTLLIGVIFSIIVARRKFFSGESIRAKWDELTRHRGFAVRTYIGNMSGVLPGTVVPIIVLNALGPTQAAYYYMPMMFAQFLSVLSGSVASALVSETSQHDDTEQHKVQLVHAIKHLFSMLVPAVIGFIALGWLVLRIYGADYAANGYPALIVLSLAALFVGINWLGDTWLVVTKRMNAFLIMNTVNSLLVLGSVYVFAQHGLVMAAVGWLIAQALTVVIYVSVFMRDALAVAFRRKV
jgi:O-antigen/teichoic acid export membrane protein